MEIKVLEPNVIVNDAPLEKIVCDNTHFNELFIEFDDINEIRYEIEFVTYIAIKVVSWDCFEGSILSSSDDGMIYEILDSDWLSQLKTIYYKRHKHEHLMDDAHHYLMILGDFVVEIIARGYKFRKLSEEGSEYV